MVKRRLSGKELPGWAWWLTWVVLIVIPGLALVIALEAFVRESFG